MMNRKTFSASKVAAASGLVVLSNLASAAVDIGPITSTLADIGIVAVAVFGVFVALHAGKWIRRML